MYNDRIREMLTSQSFSAQNTVAGPTVEYFGTLYEEGMIIAYQDDDFITYRFGCITRLLVKHSKDFFLQNERLDACASVRYGCVLFAQRKGNHDQVIRYSDLIDYMPLHAYTLDGAQL